MSLAVVVVVPHVFQRLEGHLDGQVVTMGTRVIERGTDSGVGDVRLAVLHQFEDTIVSTRNASCYLDQEPYLGGGLDQDLELLKDTLAVVVVGDLEEGNTLNDSHFGREIPWGIFFFKD